MDATSLQPTSLSPLLSYLWQGLAVGENVAVEVGVAVGVGVGGNSANEYPPIRQSLARKVCRDGLNLIGVHSPESAYSADKRLVRELLDKRRQVLNRQLRTSGRERSRPHYRQRSLAVRTPLDIFHRCRIITTVVE